MTDKGKQAEELFALMRQWKGPGIVPLTGVNLQQEFRIAQTSEAWERAGWSWSQMLWRA